MARKGAFTDDALGDIDDLLPPTPPPAPRTAAVRPTVETPSAPEELTNPAPNKPRRTPARTSAATDTTPRRTKAPIARARSTSTPEAHVASVAAEALRLLTHAEKQQRGQGRSYGAVVLDAIEHHMDELKEFFDPSKNTKPTGRLFTRVDQSRPRRRRHAEPPVKIPLAGIITADVEQLDDLVIEWHAGSRSALVDKALQLYLADEIAQLAGESDLDHEE